MALLEEQKTQIRKFMGSSGRFPDVDTRLESAMDFMSGAPYDEQELIQILCQCELIETKIENLATDCLDVVDVDGIKLRPAYALSTLRSLGTQFVAALSRMLGIKIQDGGFFSTQGSSFNAGGMGDGVFPPFG